MSFIVKTSDLSKSDAEFIVATVTQIWHIVSKETEAAEKLCTKLQLILDKRFNPSWQVLCGTDMGFAVKSRKKSAIVLSGPRHLQIVCWRSPGHELFSRDALKLIADRKGSKPDEVKSPSKAFKVVQAPKLGDAEYSLGLKDAISRFDYIIDESEDYQKMAQQIRAELSASCGPIWHVLVGTNFHAALADSGSSEIIIKKNKIRVVCFKHSEFSSGWPSLSDIASAWRSVLMIVSCILFFVHNRFCSGEDVASFCPGPDSQIVSYMAAIFLGGIVIHQVNKFVATKMVKKSTSI